MMNMSNCGKIKYGGICVIGDKTYRYRRAELSDVGQISAIYEQIRIDKNNYKTRLSDDSPLRFEKRGGMFIVMDEREIAETIADEDSFWAVFRDEDGNVAGFFWFSEKNEYYKGLKYEHIDNCIYPREVAVSPGSGSKSVAQAMYITCARAFLEAGYTTGAADLYRVLRYETEDGVFDTDQTNIPSQKAVEAIGAKFAEPLPRRVIHLDGLTVTIEPQMYIFDYQVIADLYKTVSEESHIRIIGGNEA